MRYALVGLSLLSASVFGSVYQFPILQLTLGGLDTTDGIRLTKSCEIYDDHSGIKLKEVLALVAKASQEKVNLGHHIRRETPSIEIYANYPTRVAVGPAATGVGPGKVLLLEDSSVIRSRAGEAAEQLREIVQRLCKKR